MNKVINFFGVLKNRKNRTAGWVRKKGATTINIREKNMKQG